MMTPIEYRDRLAAISGPDLLQEFMDVQKWHADNQGEPNGKRRYEECYALCERDQNAMMLWDIARHALRQAKQGGALCPSS
jgi:hypothetical protein